MATPDFLKKRSNRLIILAVIFIVIIALQYFLGTKDDIFIENLWKLIFSEHITQFLNKLTPLIVPLFVGLLMELLGGDVHDTVKGEDETKRRCTRSA